MAGLEGLFTPAAVLPGQFWGTARPVRPETTLIMAILDQAVRDFLTTRHSSEHERLREEVECWIWDGDDDPMSFVWCCEQVGLSPSAVRRRWERLRFQGSSASLRRMRDVRSGPNYALAAHL